MKVKLELSIDTELEQIATYLQQQHIISKIPVTRFIEVPGAGNMNVVLRYVYDGKSLILKQSKPYVQKYPNIPAPIQRIITEAHYYKYLYHIPETEAYTAKLIHFDPANHVLILEDLGNMEDLTRIYERRDGISATELQALLRYLHVIHQKKWTAQEVNNYPKNIELRKLNHAHIFQLPFDSENGFNLNDIQDGLAELASTYVNNSKLIKKINKLGALYLSDGNTLIHGDYYPGSWMYTRHNQMKIIDPEFSFMGMSEIDLGILCAHHLMAKGKLMTILDAVKAHYPRHKELNESLFLAFMAIEVFRRIIGLAQLPLSLSLSDKASLLKFVEPYILKF